MSGRVIVVGSVNVDLVARVDHLPAAGETIGDAEFARHPGGKGGNQAVGAARLGGRVAFVGAVGDDPLGVEARAALAGEGIDLGELASAAGPTGVALILVDRRGENVIAVAPGANRGLRPADATASLERLAIGPGDVLLVGNEIPTATALAALAAGRTAGARTILNPAPADGIDRAVLGRVDILVPNRVELERIVAEDGRRVGRRAGPTAPAALAATLLETNAAGPPVGEAVVVTLGSGGAVTIRRGRAPLEVAAPRVDAIDSVGAGDTFLGALAVALAEGRDLDAAVGRAVVAAALSTTRPGARGGMPTLAELEATLAGGGG